MPSKKAEEPQYYVCREKLSQAVDVLKELTKLRKREEPAKLPLIEDQTVWAINLQIAYKKTPYNRTTYIHWLPLPHHWRHGSDFETCLIVKDLNKTPLTDRDLDLGIS